MHHKREYNHWKGLTHSPASKIVSESLTTCIVESDRIELFDSVESFGKRNDSAGINMRRDVDSHIRDAVIVKKPSSE